MMLHFFLAISDSNSPASTSLQCLDASWRAHHTHTLAGSSKQHLEADARGHEEQDQEEGVGFQPKRDCLQGSPTGHLWLRGPADGCDTCVAGWIISRALHGSQPVALPHPGVPLTNRPPPASGVHTICFLEGFCEEGHLLLVTVSLEQL